MSRASAGKIWCLLDCGTRECRAVVAVDLVRVGVSDCAVVDATGLCSVERRLVVPED